MEDYFRRLFLCRNFAVSNELKRRKLNYSLLKSNKKMKIKAIVKHVGEVRTGTSKTTGNKWAFREILLSWTDETGKSFISASIEGDAWAGCGIEAGDNVCAELQFHTRLLPGGTVANEIRIISIQQQQNS